MAKQVPPPVMQKNVLKNILGEQTAKLQQKQQLEHELLEDIKNYSNKRAAIEKDYGQALQKLASQFHSKFMPKENESNESKTLSRTPFGLWRKVLDETEATANSRITISQDMLANVTENVKTLKIVRAVTTKTCTALAEKLQEELTISVLELLKSKKTYTDSQKLAIQTQEQADEAQDRIKKGQFSFFNTKAKTEKSFSKIQQKKDLCVKRVTMARNDYLLNLSAVNAHNQRYYSTDLPELIALQDGNIYEKFKDYFKSITVLEADACARSEKSMRQLEEEAAQLQRAHAIQLFLRLNPVFTKCLSYEFHPCDGDKVHSLSQEYGAGLTLNKEARKWALRLAKAQKTIRKKSVALQNIERSDQADDRTSQKEGPTLEQSKDALMEDIRHAEIVKMKAEARLDVLREAGINVDEWLQSASAENGEEDNNNDDQENDDEDDGWADDDSMLEPEFSDDEMSSFSNQSQQALRAYAIYSFQAASREELSITENEELEIIEQDVEGWCKGRNKAGQTGYFPETYVELASGKSSTNNSIASAPTTSKPIKEPVALPSKPSIEEPEAICSAKALYDYTALEDEELSFNEGDVIKVTNKDQNGIDDGWWEGYLNGKKGLFPSIIVEEIDDSPLASLGDWQTYDRRRINTDTFAAMPRGKRKVARRASES